MRNIVQTSVHKLFHRAEELASVHLSARTSLQPTCMRYLKNGARYTNRKLHISFQLVPKSVTSNDPEWHYTILW